LESLRFVACARLACGQVFFLCAGCDRGQRYCCRTCAADARRATLLAAGRRYQASHDGRRAHADRQRRYRERRGEKVTHHRRADPGAAAKVRAPPATSAMEAPASTGVEVPTNVVHHVREHRGACCAACGRPGRFVRLETLARAGRLHRQRRFRSRSQAS
jgi:hypothetical protein